MPSRTCGHHWLLHVHVSCRPINVVRTSTPANLPWLSLPVLQIEPQGGLVLHHVICDGHHFRMSQMPFSLFLLYRTREIVPSVVYKLVRRHHSSVNIGLQRAPANRLVSFSECAAPSYQSGTLYEKSSRSLCSIAGRNALRGVAASHVAPGISAASSSVVSWEPVIRLMLMTLDT